MPPRCVEELSRKNAPPIAEAAYSLKPGQESEIIGTPYGLELIKVADRRYKAFEEVKSALEAEYRKSKFAGAYGEMAKNYKLAMDIVYFGAKFNVQTSNVAKKPAPK